MGASDHSRSTASDAWVDMYVPGMGPRKTITGDPDTALRISEILALQWRDIDVENQCIYVRRAYVYGKFGKPKSKPSKRPVPLHPVLAAHLLNWKRETPYSQEEDLVFPSFRLKGKKPPRANMLLSDYLRPAAVKIGIVAHLEHSGSTRSGVRWHRFLWRTTTTRNSSKNCSAIPTSKRPWTFMPKRSPQRS